MDHTAWPKIQEEMRMSTQILAPCCYHPTTVLLVDDDQVALMANKGLISKYAVCKAFLSPMMADSYLKKTHLSDFADRCKKVRSPNINTHNQDLLSEIYKEIYNPARFQQISVAVLDYQMPGMNGLQLASLIRKRHPHIKILTRTAYDLHPTENAKQILEMIQSRHAIPFFCSQPDVPVDLEEWESFMYPIEKAEISGQTFYYASVSNYCDFYQAKHKILSVNQFIRSAAMA
ncbi:MAG: response regulator [Gammaproteobacteria bacterium]|nr:response regulator [Gammaproteobacteria bacterium]